MTELRSPSRNMTARESPTHAHLTMTSPNANPGTFAAPLRRKMTAAVVPESSSALISRSSRSNAATTASSSLGWNPVSSTLP